MEGPGLLKQYFRYQYTRLPVSWAVGCRSGAALSSASIQYTLKSFSGLEPSSRPLSHLYPSVPWMGNQATLPPSLLLPGCWPHGPKHGLGRLGSLCCSPRMEVHHYLAGLFCEVAASFPSFPIGSLLVAFTGSGTSSPHPFPSFSLSCPLPLC